LANANARIDIDINTSEAAAGLKRLQAQLNAFNSTLTKGSTVQATAMRNAKDNLMELVNASRFFTAETVRMQTAAGKLDKTLAKGQGTLGQFFSAKFLRNSAAAASALSLAETRAAALQTQFVATGAAANGMRDAIAIRPLQAFNNAAAVSAQKLAIHRAMLNQATTSMINFGKNTQWTGRQLMVGFTVPLTIFGAVAGKTFRELEKEAVNFKKVYGDAFTPPEEMQANLDAVKELAKEYTKYGIAVKDTIGLAAEAAAAGAQNQELLDATTQATRLATLGQMEQNEALKTTISLQNAFKLSGDELAKSVNFLNMVENQTVVTLQDLSGAIPRVAPVIKGLGGDVEDLAAFLAAMQEGGVSAAQGAQALKSGLASLINPTDKAKEKLQDMGISLDTIIQANRGDLMGTVQALADAFDTLDQFSRQQAIEEIFGKFQYARLAALFDNINKEGTQAARVLEMTGMSAAEMAASAEKELGAIEEAVGTKFTAAMEKLQLAIAPIGEMFTKLAIPVINFLSKIADAFNNLPDFAKKFIGLATVVVGLVIPAGTMFLGLLVNLVGTLTKFGAVTGSAFRGFLSGGIKGAFDAVSQSVNYMSLEQIDAATASQQLAGSTEAVNAALLGQVGASEGAQAAVMELAYAYEILTQQMREAAAMNEVVFGTSAAAMGAAGTRGPRVRRNRGGTIPGSGNTDTVPAMLTPGEFVVNKQATQDNLPLLKAINNGGKAPGFMAGGLAAMKQVSIRPLATQVGKSSIYLPAGAPGIRHLPARMQWQGKKINQDLGKIKQSKTSKVVPPTGIEIADDLNSAIESGVHPMGIMYDIATQLKYDKKTTTKMFQNMSKKLTNEFKSYGNNPISNDLYEEIIEKYHKQFMSSITREGVVNGKIKTLNLFDELDRLGMSRGAGGRRAGNVVSVSEDGIRISGQHLLGQSGGYSKFSEKHFELTSDLYDGKLPTTYSRYQQLIEQYQRGHNKGGIIQGFNKGNIVPGQGNKDTVPAMLTPGEFVINKQATQSNRALLEAINNGEIKGYRKGGHVQTQNIQGVRSFVVLDEQGQEVGRFSTQKEANKALRSYRRQMRVSGASRGGRGMGMMGGRGMGLSMLGGTAMMGGMMIPGVAQNQAASSAIMGGGMLLSMAPMLAGMGPAGLAIAGVAAAIGGTVLALKAFREETDRNVRKAAEFGSNLGGAANRMEKVSAATGYQFARQRSPLESFKFTQQEIEGASQFGEYFESETGQKFVEDLQKLDPQARYEEVRSAIAMAIADGMDKKTAKAYGDAIAFYTNDALLKSRIGRDIRSGELVKGSTAAIAEIDKRVSSAQERLPELVEAGGMSRSYLSDILGTEGMTNVIGESALTTIPFLRGIHESMDDMVDEQGNFNFSISAIANNMNPVAMFRTAAETFLPGQGGEGNVVSNLKDLGKNAESVAAQFGSSIQILKELENAEALLMEERKNGIISTQQYEDRLSKLQSLEEQQYQKVSDAVKIASDQDFTKQAVGNQLVLAGFEGDLAKTIADVTSANAVAQKMYNEDFQHLSEEQQNVVTSVISRTLTGITPENAQAKIAEIENTYMLISEQLLNAAKNGLTPQELDTAVLTQQISNFVQSAFTDVDMGRSEAATRRRLATENLVSVDTLGLRMEDVTGALGSFIDRDFALRISSSKQELNEFIPLLKELQQFPGIIVEIITETEDGRDPQDVAKDIKETLEDISKLKFKGIRKEIVEALPEAQQYISLARQAGISFDNIPGALKEAATQADALSKALDPKRTGILKQVKVGIITELFGNEYGDPAALTSAINAVFPDGVDPLYIPLILQLQNPEVLQLISGGYGTQVLNALRQGKTSLEIARGKTADQLARGGGGTVVDLTPVDMTKTPPFTGEKPKDPSGSGAGTPEKTLFQELKEQAQASQKMLAGMSGLGDQRGFKKFISGPFAPEFLEYLRSQGEKGLKLIKGGLDKVKKAYANFVRDRSAQLASQALIAPKLRKQEMNDMQTEIDLRNQLAKAGRSQEEIDFIVERTSEYKKQIAANKDLIEQEKAKPKGERNQKFIDDLREGNSVLREDIKLVKQSSEGYVDLARSLEYAQMSVKDLQQALRDNQMQQNDLQRQIAEYEVIRPLEDQLEAQQKILEAGQREIELKQRTVDEIGRQIELEQRRLEPIDDAIEKLEEQKTKVEESYDTQLKALDDIARKEDNLARIREGRLDVASALSRGDVGAAAQAAIEMQRRFAEGQQEAARTALEARRQQEIDAIQGNIKQKQEERKVIEQEIERLQLSQRDIQDEIYQKQQDLIPVQDEIYRLNNVIANEADRLDDLYSNAALQVQNLKDQLRLAKDEALALVAALNNKVALEQAANAANAAANAPIVTGEAPSTPFTGWNNEFADNPVMIYSPEQISANIDAMGRAYGGKIKKYAMGGMVNYKGSREPAPGMMYGGKMKKYAMGSFVPGRGMTDKVPAMLTPGEFVVRKSVASQYGPLLQAMNSDIFPGMRGIANDPVFYAPSVNASSLIAPISNLTAPMDNRSMQYNYSVNVNAKTDADANEIANVVINKIKRIDDRQVKGVRL
jgi:TP901 family phage tail tape measure protein